MSDHTINIKLMVDSFKRGLAQAESGIRRFTNNAKKEFSGLNKAGRSTKNILSGNWQLFGGAIAGAAIYSAAKKAMDLDDAVRRIAIDSNMGTAEMLAFKEQILSTAMHTGTSVTELTALGGAAMKSSKDVKFVREELSFMNKVMQASGASGQEVGDALGDIREKSGLAGKEFEQLVTNMYAFGKTSGRESTFKDILPQVPELLKTFKVLNPKGSFQELNDFILTSMFMDNPTAISKASKKLLGAASKAMNKNNLVALGFKPGQIPTIPQVIAAATAHTKTYEAKLLALQPIFKMSNMELGKLLNASDELAASLKTMDMGALDKDATTAAGSFAAMENTLTTMSTAAATWAIGPMLDELKKGLQGLTKEDLDGLKSTFEALGTSIAATVGWGIKFLNWWGEMAEKAGKVSAGDLSDFPGFAGPPSSGQTAFERSTKAKRVPGEVPFGAGSGTTNNFEVKAYFPGQPEVKAEKVVSTGRHLTVITQ